MFPCLFYITVAALAEQSAGDLVLAPPDDACVGIIITVANLRAFLAVTVWKNCQVSYAMLLFDDNKVKMVRKPGKKQKENPVGCAGESKR